jgi:hypothetical protein
LHPHALSVFGVAAFAIVIASVPRTSNAVLAWSDSRWVQAALIAALVGLSFKAPLFAILAFVAIAAIFFEKNRRQFEQVAAYSPPVPDAYPILEERPTGKPKIVEMPYEPAEDIGDNAWVPDSASSATNQFRVKVMGAMGQ